MLYSPLILKAARIMHDAHKNDFDKSGYPYCMHPIHLAEQMTDELSCCAALLHDVVEDHGDRYGFETLSNEGFPEEVIRALRLLTHAPGVPYMDYIRAISKDPVARAVKIADLLHNTDTARMDGRRAPKYDTYMEALAFLRSV